MLLLLLSIFLFSSPSQGKEYQLVIKTADKFKAGTDAQVKVKIHGTKGDIGGEGGREVSGSFEQGGTDRPIIEDYDIGYVTGMEIKRGDQGFLPDWKLDYIIIKVAGAKDSRFNKYGWIGESWTSLPLSCTDGNVINSQGYCNVADVNECQTANPCISPATCHNTVGSYYCTCPSGYALKEGNKNECEDINECQTGNTCDAIMSTCVNLPGDYRCDCKPGYESVNSKQCQNVNECTKGTDSCNKTSSDCVDSDGNYWCRCKDGYTPGANNKICVAIACGPLATPYGSTLEPARCTEVNKNFYGDKCVMKCKVGYVISDISHGIVTCASTGRWEGTMGSCNAVTCPKLPAIPNGNLVPSSCASTGGKYTDTCTYYCTSGYSLQGNPTRACQSGGTWDGATPTCKKIEVQPWIRCPDLIIQDLLPGQSTADVSSVWKEPTSNVEQITISPPEISSSYQFPPGTTKVTWTASNAVGSESCSIYVIINDKEAPTVANCPQDIHQISDGPKAVTWAEPTFSDNVKVTKVERSHTSGGTFQLGSTYVSYDAQDAAGNRKSCNFEVELKRPDCHNPEGPVGGTKSCSSYGGTKFCTVMCNPGSQLYKATKSWWKCNAGVWDPSDSIPDCVESTKKEQNTPCQENRIEMVVKTFGNDEIHCAKCPTGTYKSSNTICSNCPAGTYNDQQGQLQCTQNCPSGTSSLPGAKSSSDCKPPCSAGQYSVTGLGPNCQYCPRDTYQDQPQMTSCIACPNGTTTMGMGTDSLSKCGVKPTVRVDPMVSNINEGESVSVNCLATGKPTPTYIWKFLSDIPADFLGTMSQTSIKDASDNVIGSKLTITGATYENTGSYECSVTNTHGQDKALAQINVAKVIDVGSGSDEPL